MSAEAATIGTRVEVIAHFVAAGAPYRHPFDISTTVGEVKAAALAFFGLSEGTQPDGSSVTYKLFYQRQELTNMSQKIGDLVGEHRVMELKLTQQITQGACVE